MKYRIKDITTGNYVSFPLQNWEATKWCDKMNDNAGCKRYTVVGISEEVKKLKNTLTPMSRDVLEAIKHLKNISYAPGSNHSSFANILIQRVSENKCEITEKEEVYLWYIVYRYRRQIENAKLILTAKQNKVY